MKIDKPVAWQVAEMVFTIEESAIEMAKVYGDEIIPLYTNPVKELTLDELKELFAQSNIQTEFSHLIVEFARAILRKAQEK